MANRILTPAGGVGSLEVIDRLGVGGVAEIFRAVKRMPGQPGQVVAIKKLRADVAGQGFFSDRFMAEVDLVKMFRHVNLVGGHEVGMLEGLPYVVLDYVDGKDLGTVMRTRQPPGAPLEHAQAVHVVMELLKGLGHVHRLESPGGQELRVVHRDVTPDNVLVGYDGDVRLTDFGIALVNGIELEGAEDEVTGKLGYLSPEQVTRGPLDARSDLFAVGAILYELTVGRPAFAPGKGESEGAVLARVAEARVVRPSRVDPDFPRDLEAVILRALERKPEKRFQDADAFWAALDDLAFTRADERARLGHFLRSTYAGEYQRMRLTVPASW